jgi:hypothetical protein
MCANFDVQSVAVCLKDLAAVTFTAPQFRPLTDFAIRSLIYQGDYSALFNGLLDGRFALLETCARIPYSLVCREVKLLNDLRIPGTISIIAVAKQPSVGVITLAYDPVMFRPWTDPIPVDCLPLLLLRLLEIVARLHEREVHHSFICRSSVYVSHDLDTVTLGAFHAAGKVGEPAPFVPTTSCSPPVRAERDRRPDDVYAAGAWCLSYVTEDVREVNWEGLTIDKRLRRVLQKMVIAEAGARITAQEACAALREFAET